MKYIFFYDETEHSRKINYETVTANNYYDNFITGIVGWKAEEDECISDRYLAFESKYAYRKKDGELKSRTMKAKDFRLGFASLNNHTIEFYEDLVSLFDEKIIIYFSVFSKIEYVISQLFVNYHSSMFVDVDYMKYSIIKAINVYRPQNVIEAIYKEPQIFVKELRSFLEDRIIKNQANTTLKEHENQAFQEILLLLEDTEVSETLDWSYFAPFDGFKKLLTEMNVNEYQLMIDREGKESHTLNSAKNVGYADEVEDVLAAAELLAKEGISCDVYKLVRIFPFEEELIHDLSSYPVVLMAEECVACGGIGEHLARALQDAGWYFPGNGASP